MEEKSVIVEREGAVVRLVLNRPERHNAFDDRMIAELDRHLTDLQGDSTARVVQLRATGKSFSAGADLEWMRRAADYTDEQNTEDAAALAHMLRRLDTLPQATMALVQGAAYGGGVGLVAACDMAVAVESAAFCLSEVRLGLVPAVISPFVIAAMGSRAARRYFLTAERFDANEAHRIGLVHEVVAGAAELNEAAGRLTEQLLGSAPGAVAEAKRLISATTGRAMDDKLEGETARWIARLRAGPEGREGIAAFLEKRKPDWSE